MLPMVSNLDVSSYGGFLLKVYTCASESVLAEFIPISTPKFKFYRDREIPYSCFEHLAEQLRILKEKVRDNSCKSCFFAI